MYFNDEFADIQQLIEIANLDDILEFFYTNEEFFGEYVRLGICTKDKVGQEVIDLVYDNYEKGILLDILIDKLVSDDGDLCSLRRFLLESLNAMDVQIIKLVNKNSMEGLQCVIH